MRGCDVVIVGGGIGGSALGTALAEDGLDVVVLEASETYEDRVRGESMMPWGVNEARELGVARVLVDAGAHQTPAWLQYDAALPTQITLDNPIPVGMMVPGVPGSLNLRHPDACTALATAAAQAGAEVVRGAKEVTVSPGQVPSVRFTSPTEGDVELRARLVVGADGRNSTVRRQAGIELHRQAETHMIAGLLVHDVAGLPGDHDFLASEGDLFMAAFQQGDGALRVYLCPGLAQRHRFTGRDGLAEFLRSSAFGCLPFGEAIAASRPAGPLATFPGDDTWTDRPVADGVVLVGDAAGYNNPVIGQGLSIAMRDARTVRDVVRGGDLGPGAFGEYATERSERMRRLRTAATFMAAVFAEDADDRASRRARFFELQETEPLMLGLLAAVFGGPESGPPEAFDGRLLSALCATQPAAASA